MKRRSFLGVLAAIPLAPLLPDGSYRVEKKAIIRPRSYKNKALYGFVARTKEPATLTVRRSSGAFLFSIPMRHEFVSWTASPGEEILGDVVFETDGQIDVKPLWVDTSFSVWSK